MIFIKYVVICLISMIQLNGNKEIIESILKKNLCILKKTIKNNPIFILFLSVKKIKPFCDLKSLKVNGRIYKIPVEIKLNKQKSLVIKWIISSLFEKKENFFQIKLSKELIDTYNFSSKTIVLCENFHKIAEINKIYIQFRF